MPCHESSERRDGSRPEVELVEAKKSGETKSVGEREDSKEDGEKVEGDAEEDKEAKSTCGTVTV